MKPAFTQALDQSRGDNVYLVHGGKDHTEQSSWYFIRVGATKTSAFLKAIKTGAIDLESYGTILESGYGKEPPHSVVEYMRASYGYAG
jgi:hypothetical protein